MRMRQSSCAISESLTESPLGESGLVEVLRDAAEEERPAGPEQETGVDIGRLGNDALLEQAVDLVCDCLQHLLDDLLAHARGVLEDDRIASVRERGERGG